jgi:hypothetical protein
MKKVAQVIIILVAVVFLIHVLYYNYQAHSFRQNLIRRNWTTEQVPKENYSNLIDRRSKTERFDFFKDGTVIHYDGHNTNSGYYKIIDRNVVKVNLKLSYIQFEEYSLVFTYDSTRIGLVAAGTGEMYLGNPRVLVNR